MSWMTTDANGRRNACAVTETQYVFHAFHSKKEIGERMDCACANIEKHSAMTERQAACDDDFNRRSLLVGRIRNVGGL
ncbi:hypothetical protein FKM82_029058 [Ascaphus truei]